MKTKKGTLSFVHPKYSNTAFRWEENNLNNEIMYWFDHSPAMFHGTMRDVKKIANHIKNTFTLI